jgi:hypothetical protein
MIELLFEIDGNTGGTPINAEEISLKSDWNNNSVEDKSEGEITTNSLQFALEDAGVINNRIASGLNGGLGIFEGVPYKIKIRDLSTKITAEILDGFIDLADENSIISCDQVDSIVKKRKTLDWLTNRADGISFAFLASLPVGTAGRINTTDYVPVPYVLNYRPEGYAVVMISMSIYMSTQALIEAVKALADSISDFVAVLSAGTSVDIGDAIAAGLKVVATAAYAAALVIALVKMTEELIDQLFPPVRRYRGMNLKTMFERGFEFLGLQFSSTIFNIAKWQNTVYLPQKSERGGILGKVNGVGHPNQSSAVYNFGDFLRVFKDFFNAQIKIVGNVVHFERYDYWDSKATWSLPSVETDQDKRLSSFKYNTDEMLSNFMLSFQTDYQDENTLENFKGTNYQVITQPNVVSNQDYVNIKGFGEVRAPFARALRKDGLTTVEKLLSGLATVVDTTVNTLGGNSQLSSKIKNRKGMMLLSADTTGMDKLLVMSNEKIPSGDSNQLNASDLWDFHAINSFVEITDPVTGQLVHNQYKIYDDVTIPFCYNDWLALLGNNKFITETGAQGEMLSLEWDINNEKANISYKVKTLYTKNLKLAFNEGE